ncbi:MAG TPA: PqqD family protein [Pyrinomonadaceae bacterium]|nr:PqqD family protein [Pyrinomonadaceae bacterium]
MSDPLANRGAARAFDHVVSTDFEGGEGVLVDLNTRKYYRLNETAMLVWRGLEKGRSLEEIVEEMTGEYEVTREHARESVARILDNFKSLRLAG